MTLALRSDPPDMGNPDEDDDLDDFDDEDDEDDEGDEEEDEEEEGAWRVSAVAVLSPAVLRPSLDFLP
jgi:hypothetical protein